MGLGAMGLGAGAGFAAAALGLGAGFAAAALGLAAALRAFGFALALALAFLAAGFFPALFLAAARFFLRAGAVFFVFFVVFAFFDFFFAFFAMIVLPNVSAQISVRLSVRLKRPGRTDIRRAQTEALPPLHITKSRCAGCGARRDFWRSRTMHQATSAKPRFIRSHCPF
jgi:hypothetical protein